MIKALCATFLVAFALGVGGAAAHPSAIQTLVQQASKLTGPGGTIDGWSIALSAKGTTALVGSPSVDGGVGAAYVFTRSGETWTREATLTGRGGTGNVDFGYSVALSADGTKALIGGPADGSTPTYALGAGAVWVFTLTGSTWTQDAKLTPNDATGKYPLFGSSVALSADGATALIGGPQDELIGTYMGVPDIAPQGAAWVFTGSGTTWTQQGAKLTANNEVLGSYFASTVALSADGNTALIASPFAGAAWVFTRSSGVWTQGPTLTGTGETANPAFGNRIALSADGTTAAIAGPGDNGQAGAVWMFSGGGSNWSQQGAKLTPAGESGEGEFGAGVALTADGNTVLIGGALEDAGVGAAWTFTRSGSSWHQDQKLTVTGEGAKPNFGAASALDADGKIALIADEKAVLAFAAQAAAPAPTSTPAPPSSSGSGGSSGGSGGSGGSSGGASAQCIVPALVGKSLAAARAALISADCAAGSVTYRHANAASVGRVLAQGKAVGTHLAAHATVALVVGRS